MAKLLSELAKGTWNSATAYTIGDIVDHNGSSYICIANNTNQTPPNAAYWALLSSKGDTGATGAQGPQGEQGIQGSQGDAGVSAGLIYTFDDAVDDTDPGNGEVKFNNATLSSVTNIYIDNLESGGGDVSSFIDAWDDSTDPNVRGIIKITKVGAEENFAIFNVTGSVVDGTGYRKITVAHVASSGSFTLSDALSILFSRTGDKGLDGQGSGDVVGPASVVDGNFAAFDTTTGKLIKDSGKGATSFDAAGAAAAVQSNLDTHTNDTSAHGVTGTLVGDTDSMTLTNKDLSDPSNSANATKIQGRTVVATAPTDGQALVWDDTNSQWEPGTVSGGGGSVDGPQGFLINGKIVPSVTSNNLTVALKTLSGADPSPADPIYVRIGDTVRTITAALSVTRNAGTNWFNAGSTELAAKEVDYFVYLGYNATDGVVIGFSRIPYARQYSDFSTTTTNDLYCAISTITNATSTDYYEVIGRFAATLSGGAGYTWTVPTFTAANLVQQPIYTTRKLSYFPVLSAGSPLTVTSQSSQSGFYFIVNNLISVFGSMVQGKGGTAQAHDLHMSIPLVLANQGLNVPCGFATIDNKYGAVGLYGSAPGTNKVQIRAASNFNVDGVGRWCQIGGINLPIV